MKWRCFFERQRRDEELAREIESYLEHETDERMAAGRDRGVSPKEARRAAQRKLGNATRIREEVYRMNSMGLIETLWQDLRYAVRVLRKSPGFATVAVLSMALGIGVNTAMFSVINTVLLRSMPYPQPDQLVRVGNQGGQGAVTISEYEFWKEHSRVFSSVAGYRGGGERRIVWGTDGEWISTMTVTVDFLRTLGVRPALGREFRSEETRAGGPHAIILSDGLWRRRFGADPQALGRAITLDDTNYTVVGILPSGFWFPQSAGVLVPLRPTGGLRDTGMNTQLIARLQDGITFHQAQAEMATITERFRRVRAGSAFSGNYRGLAVISYQNWLIGDARLNLLLLFGATGLLLVMSCSNLATLLLTRFAARGKEVAVRLALGSSQGRLLTQFFIENLLVASLGASAGLFAAKGLLEGLVAWMPFDLPASTPIRLDGPVLAFSVTVATATALAFTLAGWLAARHLNVLESLKSAGRTGTGAVLARMRNVLVVSEVALSTTLLIAASLLIQSLYRVYQERLGFVPEGLITFQTPLAAERQRNATDRLNFTRAMLERLQALPGVRGVAATNVLPLVGWSNIPTQHDGRPEQSIGGMEIRAVTPAYFELMGIPVRRGRSFTDRDTGTSLPVAVVNETLARAWWQQGDAIGDRVIIGRYQARVFGKDSPREVIGVVGDTKTTLKDPARPTVFVPVKQTDALGVSSLSWIVRSAGSAGLAEELRRATTEVDPSQRIRQLRAMDEIVASTTAISRFNASLFAIFAGVALALAAIGVYGLVSFVVAQRRQEIGTRIALGATRADVLRLFFKQSVALTAIGLGLGLLGANFLTRWLGSLVYGVQTRDLLTFATASLVLLLAALTATYFPARRATKIDPMVALRYE
ncbi:MAG: ADOP family duplicated permease [Vicinamibacterales bacterium]